MLPKPNIFLVHGSALHATIAAYAENIIKNEKNSLESLQHLFVQEWHLSKEKQKIQVSQEEQDEFIKKGQQQIRNFFFRESCRQSRRPYLVERKFVVDVNKNIKLSGVWDRVDLENSKHVIVEYKTQLSEYRLKTESFLQLKVYSYAFEKVFGVRPASAIIMSIDSGECLEFEPTEETAMEVEFLLVNVAAIIEKGLFEARPSKNNCRFCPYRDSCPKSYYSVKQKVLPSEQPDNGTKLKE